MYESLFLRRLAIVKMINFSLKSNNLLKKNMKRKNIKKQKKEKKEDEYYKSETN